MKTAGTVEFEEDLKLGLRNMWYPICRSEAVKSEPAGLRRLGEDIVAWRAGVYRLSDDERAAVLRGLAAAQRGDFVSDEEMNEFRNRHR